MTADEIISISRLAKKVDDMAEDMVTKDLLRAEVGRIDVAIEAHMKLTQLAAQADSSEMKRLDEKFKDSDVKYQIQFSAAKEALGIALIAQEKAVAAALDATKEAIGKADIATSKQFDLLSEKIDGVNDTLNKNTGAQGIYVTHTDLTIALDKLQTSIEASLRPVVTFMNSQTGSQKGAANLWGYIIGAIGVISAILAIVSRF